MSISTINPATGDEMESFDTLKGGEIEACLARSERASRKWSAESFSTRAALLGAVASRLRDRKQELGRLITRDMGKLIGEAEAEVEKCAWVCDYYAEETEAFLADQPLASDAGRSMVAFEPLGTLLAIMPWNFPFWQLFRCAAPALAAGNSVLLKHASNVPRCALIIEELFQDAGAPRGFFQTMLIGADQTEQVIADARVQGVSLAGSEATGRKVASTAGRHLKKLVLELGGSDAFVVLDDAGLEKSARVAVQSRFVKAVSALRPGDPLDGDTTLAPMAREDLRDALHKQVLDSVSKGAELLVGDRLLDQRQNPLDQLRLPESFMDHQVTLLMSEFVTRDVQRFILTRPEGFAFEPGQGVELAIDHPDWRGEGRPFTPTSLEEDRVLEFTIKGYPDHEGVTKALHGLQPGAGLIMSEPFGTIRYKGRGVFIAGGAGVTPFIAILRRLARDDGLDGHALLFSTKTPADVICEKELRHMMGERCVLTCTEETAPGYEGRRIDRDFLTDHIDDFSQHFYVCGPPKFNDAVNAELKSLGAEPDLLVFEE